MSNYKLYQGVREYPEELTLSEVTVTVTEQGRTRELRPEPSQKVYNHSPTGFSWGYEGSGPAQLALAIMLDFFEGDSSKAIQFYQRFKRHAVATWQTKWQISSPEIEKMIADFAQNDNPNRPASVKA